METNTSCARTRGRSVSGADVRILHELERYCTTGLSTIGASVCSTYGIVFGRLSFGRGASSRLPGVGVCCINSVWIVSGGVEWPFLRALAAPKFHSRDGRRVMTLNSLTISGACG